MTEYVILLIAIAIFALSIAVEYGRSVESQFAGANEAPAWNQIASNLDGGSGPGSGGCPFYYNASTGRWHDPSTNLFVSFDDAGSSGCS